MISLETFVKNKDILVVAHRGSSGAIPENSLSAYRQAIEDGSDMIEMDVQITLDNQIVAYHDFVPYGFEEDLSNLNYEVISNIDIGNGYDSKYKGEKIPLLEDAIKLIENKNYLMLEIKTIAGNNFTKNAEFLLDLIHKYNYLDKTLVGSFNHSALSILKKIQPNLRTAAIKIPGDVRLPSEIKTSIGCDAFICDIDELNHSVEEDSLNSGLFIGVYSIDTKSQFEEALKYNVTALATNYPSKVRQWLEE